MSETKKKEKNDWNEKTWALDCRLALMQRTIWILCALIAILGGVMIMRFMPENTAQYGVITLAILLMLGYQWTARAPQRALNGWIVHRNQGTADPKDVLAFVEALEKKLPAMKKKEMTFALTEVRAVMLFMTGKRQEGIELLENFDLCWHDVQRERIAHDLRKMREKMGQTPEEKEENACEQ